MPSNTYKLNILVSTPGFLPVVGGAEMGIHEIYNRLGMKHNITILTPSLSHEMLAAYSANDHMKTSYRVHRFDDWTSNIRPLILRRALSLFAFSYYQNLRREIREVKPDVINYHFIAPQGAAMIAIKSRYKIPAALSLVARTDVIGSVPFPLRVYSRICIKATDMLLPNSKFYLAGESTRKPTDVIPYGVDTHAFTPEKYSKNLRKKLGIHPAQIMLFTVQRLASIKRVDVLVNVMSIVTKKNNDIVLVIGGKGKEYNRLRKQIERLNLTKNVKMAGYIPEDELPEYFASAQMFIFHSMFETFGIVFAQAMAAGLPIVAAKTSCVPEVVPDKVSGLLIEPFDTESFSAAILQLVDDKGMRKSMGSRNRKRAVNEFNWDVIAKQYEKAFYRLTKERSKE